MLKLSSYLAKESYVENIPNLFWISVLAWVYAEMSAFFRIALITELKDEAIDIKKDRALRYYTLVSIIALNLAALLGSIIIGVSIYNIIKGVIWTGE